MDKTKETLEKQLQLLYERSSNAESGTLIQLTREMISLALILSPELQNRLACAYPYPFVGHLSMSDLEELALARSERARRQLEEDKQFYKRLESQ